MNNPHDKEKAVIALGFYKKILRKKLIELEKYAEVSDDKFHSNITHNDINKMAEYKLITYEIAHELNKHVNHD